MSKEREARLVHNMSEHKDLFKMGAWLEVNGNFKSNRDLRKTWWFHSITCLIV